LSLYLDTSVIVAIFAKEDGADELAALIQRSEFSPLVLSTWNLTEFAAAISFKFSMGQISATVRTAALANFDTAKTTMFDVIAIEDEDFTRAATFANQHGLRLRGGDALHLSIASGRHLRILTLDKRMVAAANTLGIGVVALP
jgi:uncharacterized protein